MARSDAIVFFSASRPAFARPAGARARADTSAVSAGASLSQPATVNISGAAISSNKGLVQVSSGVTKQVLRDAGYLLLDDFENVDPTGVAFSTIGFNAAALEAQRQQAVVWLSEGATYKINDTIKCGSWDVADGAPQFQGGGRGLTAPRIVLANGSSGFGSAGTPRPVICFRLFEGNTNLDPLPTGNIDEFWPPDPMNETNTYTSGTASYPNNVDLRGRSPNYFGGMLSNIYIDCGVNAGAFGIYMPMAQNSHMIDVTVNATSALGCFWGFPGRNSPSMNLTAIGGVWQINNDSSARKREGSAGAMIAGLTLIGDSRTTQPIIQGDFIPLCITGFDVTMTRSNQPLIVTTSNSRSAYNALVMIDGIIRSAGGRVFDNESAARNIYLRNVYITGTNAIIKSGTAGEITQSGTWKRIGEYAYTVRGATLYEQEALIDGVTITSIEPVVSYAASSAPTIDYVARHIINVPKIDDGAYVSIEDYGAVASATGNVTTAYSGNYDASTADSLSAITAAMSAAEAAGHNRVFVPGNLYFIGSPGLLLLKDTIMFGISSRNSKIGTKSVWKPTSPTFMVTTTNDATGSCHWSHVGLAMRTVPIGGNPGSFNQVTPYPNDWFSFINWRTGKNSSSIVVDVNQRQWQRGENITNEKFYHYFTGAAGGKHYGLDCSGRQFGNIDCRSLRIEGTTQPLHIYGANTEISKKQPTNGNALVNIEITGSENIRIYSSKREGDAATSIIEDSQNVCLYAFGRQTEGRIAGALNTHRVTGASNHIIITPSTFDDTVTGTAPTNHGNPREDIDALGTFLIEWPKGCSYYRRGSPDDALVTI